MATPAADGPRLLGHVKWFDAQKGWGFIEPKDGSEDVFVHQQSICAEGFRSLDDGEDVEYSVETDGSRRKRAVNVTGPGGAPVKGSSRNYGVRGRGGPFHQNGGGGRPSAYESGNNFRGSRRGGHNRYDDQNARYEGRFESRYDRPSNGYDRQGNEYAEAPNHNRGGDYRRTGGGAPEWDRKMQSSRQQHDHLPMINQTYPATSSSVGRERL